MYHEFIVKSNFCGNNHTLIPLCLFSSLFFFNLCYLVNMSRCCSGMSISQTIGSIPQVIKNQPTRLFDDSHKQMQLIVLTTKNPLGLLLHIIARIVEGTLSKHSITRYLKNTTNCRMPMLSLNKILRWPRYSVLKL